ncbi:hypothetical protein J1614_001386 [Plenodomus biglobosus]|nr:hypothetical protein J1614_001386 [Plenodomus biglobosus]
MMTTRVVRRVFNNNLSLIMPMQPFQVEIPQLEVNDGISSMWATLALARLDQVGDTMPQFGHGFRTALQSFYQQVAHHPLRHHWDDLAFTSRDRDTLKRAAVALVNNTSATDREKQDFAYLWGMIDQFLEKLPGLAINYGSSPLGELPCRTQLARKFSELTASLVEQLLIEVNSLMDHIQTLGDVETITQIRQEIRAYALWIQSDLEEYIQQQTSLKIFEDNDPDGFTGNSFLALMRSGEDQNSPSSLLMCIRSALVKLIDNAVSLRRLGQHDYETMLSSLVAIFYEDLARYFSVDSPLLSHHQLYPPASRPIIASLFDENSPLPVSSMDEDTDFHGHDHGIFSLYEPADFGDDVLTGPNGVEVDDVSEACINAQDRTCAICYQQEADIRMIRPCGHEMGASCLQQQLDSGYHTRHRCPFCRAKFSFMSRLSL